MESRTPQRRFVRILIAMSAILLAAGACAADRGTKPVLPELYIPAIERDVVSRLSGQSEIRPGLTIPDRSALDNRQAARSYLEAVWKGLGLAVERQAYSAEGENLFAVLKATTPSDEYILLGAHYDSARNTPGANDNATGCALVTAAAGELIRAPSRSRNIIFVLFDEEERGLRGSRAFAEKMKTENLKIHSVHTIDQMGWDEDGDRAVELEIPCEGAIALYEEAVRSMPSSIPILVTKEAGSDHSAFRKLGFPAVGVTEEYRNKDTTPHIHRPGDTFETINFDYLKSTTVLVVRVLKILTTPAI